MRTGSLVLHEICAWMSGPAGVMLVDWPLAARPADAAT